MTTAEIFAIIDKKPSCR